MTRKPTNADITAKLIADYGGRPWIKDGVDTGRVYLPVPKMPVRDIPAVEKSIKIWWDRRAQRVEYTVDQRRHPKIVNYLRAYTDGLNRAVGVVDFWDVEIAIRHNRDAWWRNYGNTQALPG